MFDRRLYHSGYFTKNNYAVFNHGVCNLRIRVVIIVKNLYTTLTCVGMSIMRGGASDEGALIVTRHVQKLS